MNEIVYRHLNFCIREYDGVVKKITQSKNRLKSLNPDSTPERYHEIFKPLDTLKLQLSSEIEKQLRMIPVWSEFAAKVKGCGPWIAGTLALLWSAKLQPICGKCGANMPRPDGSESWTCPTCNEKAKGDGLLFYRMVDRDFETVSKWWKFIGMSVDPATGKKIRRHAGQSSGYNAHGRQALYQFGVNAIFKNKDPFYKDVYEIILAHKERNRPELKPGHMKNQARHETAKLFASHWWAVARTIEGKAVSRPYVHAVLGHTNYIEPPYFEGKINYVELAA